MNSKRINLSPKTLSWIGNILFLVGVILIIIGLWDSISLVVGFIVFILLGVPIKSIAKNRNNLEKTDQNIMIESWGNIPNQDSYQSKRSNL